MQAAAPAHYLPPSGWAPCSCGPTTPFPARAFISGAAGPMGRQMQRCIRVMLFEQAVEVAVSEMHFVFKTQSG